MDAKEETETRQTQETGRALGDGEKEWSELSAPASSAGSGMMDLLRQGLKRANESLDVFKGFAARTREKNEQNLAETERQMEGLCQEISAPASELDTLLQMLGGEGTDGSPSDSTKEEPKPEK